MLRLVDQILETLLREALDGVLRTGLDACLGGAALALESFFCT
jgi:hypothetical protein